MFYVSHLKVIDSGKFAAAFPSLADLPGNRRAFKTPNDVTIYDFKMALRRFREVAGVFDPEKYEILESLDQVAFADDAVAFEKIKKPFRVQSANYWRLQHDKIFCHPAHIQEKRLISSQEAKRKWIIPADLQPRTCCFRIERNFPMFGSGNTGLWFIAEELASCPLRSAKDERTVRNKRKRELLARFSKLPKGWNQFTDEQLAIHFQIEAQAAAGERLAVTNHQGLLDLDNEGRELVLTWLRSNTDFVLVDPTTKTIYVKSFASITEFASHPDFQRLLDAVFGNLKVLQDIVLSANVQATVGASRV